MKSNILISYTLYSTLPVTFYVGSYRKSTIPKRRKTLVISHKTWCVHAPCYYNSPTYKIQEGGLYKMIKYDKLWITLKKKNISQYKLIKYYGVDKAQLQRLRNNEIVKTLIINRLCNILDCNVEDIMEYVPDEKTSKS